MKRRFSWTFWRILCVGALLVLLTGCPGAGGSSKNSILANRTVDAVQGGPKICEIPEGEEELVEGVIELVNSERADYDLPPVSHNPILSAIAEDFACEMIERGFFPKDHINPHTGEGPYERAVGGGYLFLAVGENLAAGQTSPGEVISDWMNSIDHRGIILGAQWSEIGVGIRTGGEYGVYWVLEFGNPP